MDTAATNQNNGVLLDRPSTSGYLNAITTSGTRATLRSAELAFVCSGENAGITLLWVVLKSGVLRF